MNESRHHIKTRMLKNAARAWGYPETEAENNFDPLVSMLLSACSVELEKISDEIHSSRARVLERLVQLMAPDVLAAALPAHAIAYAFPIEAATKLLPEAQLYTQIKMPYLGQNEEYISKDIFFSPTASFHLARASIRFMAAGDQLYKINYTISKEIIARADPGRELPPSTIWLAIDEPGVNLHESLFYFDIRNEAEKHLFYDQLPKASWHIDGQMFCHLPGYGDREICGEQLDLNNILSQENEVSSKIKTHINAFYKQSFITISDPGGITAKAGTVGELPGIISATFRDLQPVKKHSLRWICIQFPEIISSRLLQDVMCVMNCFPVMNRHLHNTSYRLREMVNIIPLQTDDLFLDLEEVSDDQGKVLQIQSQGKGDDESVAILMRNGGVGRFDERNAGAIVDYLLQLLRDDSAAFSTLDNDFMNGELKQLQQIINKLEQRLYSSHLHRQQTPYLVIRNNIKDPWHNLFIRYWSTNGTDANNIKAGTGLQLYKGGSLDTSQAMLVTTTQGGRNKLGTTETVLAYKSALLTNDRLVTPEDIKAFCHYQVGERVKKIKVQKGVMIHPAQHQGFIKTIDVVIEINKKPFQDMIENGELIFWTKNLQLLLEEKSFALMPFRVFIRQEE